MTLVELLMAVPPGVGATPQTFLLHGAEEILTGLLWLAVGFLLERLFRFVSAKKLEKRFPLSGLYLTKFTDKSISYSDMVHIKQHGLKITGASSASSDSAGPRRWLFEGEIRERGYILGGYRPESPFDKGFGAYFLKFNRDGDMHGYWLGHDSEEKEIAFGTYSWLKQPKFTIGSVTVSDQSQVLQIAEQRLGDAYIDSTTLIMSDENVALCVKVDGFVGGFITGQRVKSSDFLDRIENHVPHIAHNLKPLKRRLENHDFVGFIASAAVKPSLEGRGIGAELIGGCILELEKRGAQVLVATAWQSKEGVMAGSILECRGFQKLLAIEKYWEKDSLEHGYQCPACGVPPCVCTAVLYIRNRH